MEFHSLQHTPLVDIHAAFIDAFSEYEVPMELPLDRLQSMMHTRNYAAELSLGCFVDAQLVGFVLVGARRDGDGMLRTYDVATGVIRAYQNQRVGSHLLTQLLHTLPQAGAISFQLEVLEHNTAAQALYTKHGFTVTRALHCYRTMTLPAPVATPGTWQRVTADALADVDETVYSSFVPSWQQALASYRNMATACHVDTYTVAGQLVAYGIVEQATGAIMQIGIHPAQRDIMLVHALWARMAQTTNVPHLRMVNVEANSWLDAQLRALGWENFINQYEMAISFAT